MKGYLLAAGANKYKQQGCNLSGCINDLNNVLALCQSQYTGGNWSVDVLADENCTAKNIKDVGSGIASRATQYDCVWIHNSTHGTAFPIDNVMHHATCPYDFDWNDLSTFMLDRDWVAFLNKFNPKTRVLFTSDSCHAMGLIDKWRDLQRPGRKVRGLVPPDFVRNKTVVHKASSPLVGNKLDIAAGFGCAPDQTSADVTGPDGIAYGAYTNALIRVLKQSPKSAFKDVTKRIVQYMKQTGETQRPTCQGRECDRVPMDQLLSRS